MRYWLWAAQPTHFATFAQTGTFAVRRQGRSALRRMRNGDRIIAVVTKGKGVAGLFEVVGEPFEDATSLLHDKATPHRVRVRRLAALPEDDWIPTGPLLDELTVLREYPQFDSSAERLAAILRQLVHELPTVDGKVLEFTIHARQAAPLGPILDFVERFIRDSDASHDRVGEPVVPCYEGGPLFERTSVVEAVIAKLGYHRFEYAPYEVAAFLTALRTKPFVLLAGPTGVGKSALPRLVAEATGSSHILIPVQPDWADDGETMGYVDLAGHFRPGVLLRAAQQATDQPERQHLAVLDEMNVARPEQYLAAVLSRLEARHAGDVGYVTEPLLDSEGVPEPWASTPFPATLSLIGTVNVDESTIPFSRKVLDRAFVLEFGGELLRPWVPDESNDVALRPAEVMPWPVEMWQPRALRLAELVDLADEEQALIAHATRFLAEVDAILRPSGFTVGYRTRDEVALFVLHASEVVDAFRTDDGTPVDPFDVALVSKVLPRLAGGSQAFAEAIQTLLAWAIDPDAEKADIAPRDAGDTTAAWPHHGRYPRARFPCTAARLAGIIDRLERDGYTSFWG
ncbi:MAG: AAA family ATPase [Bacteroidota bacterium]